MAYVNHDNNAAYDGRAAAAHQDAPSAPPASDLDEVVTRYPASQETLNYEQQPPPIPATYPTTSGFAPPSPPPPLPTSYPVSQDYSSTPPPPPAFYPTPPSPVLGSSSTGEVPRNLSTSPGTHENEKESRPWGTFFFGVLSGFILSCFAFLLIGLYLDKKRRTRERRRYLVGGIATGIGLQILVIVVLSVVVFVVVVRNVEKSIPDFKSAQTDFLNHDPDILGLADYGSYGRR